MKKLLKLLAVVIAAAGAIGLGWLLNYISSNAQYIAIGLLGVLAVIFIGGGGLVALFIFLWGRASGDFDRPQQVADQTDEASEQNET